MLYSLICDGTTKEKSLLKYKVKVKSEIKGENVGLISFLIGRPIRPLIRALIRGAQPLMVGGPPLHSAKIKKGVRGRGTQHKVRRAAYTLTHRNPKPIY